MAVKLLMLMLVIGAIYFLGRYHAVRKRRLLARQAGVGLVQEEPLRREVRWALYGGGAVVGLALMLYSVHTWEKSRELVRVRVININNGQSQLYETRRHLVGVRSFQTPEGRRVALADVERMEVEEPVP